MLVRDEADIIGQCLDALLQWIDGLYILDLGSTDGTWEIVQEYATRDARIVPFEHAPILYNDNLRSYLFHHFRNRFNPGDWVMKIDADEFYHIPPPQFVRERLRRHETAVHLQWYFFRLTQNEVADYERGVVDVIQDRKKPIEQRRRYYKISEYAEPRMFQYRRTMQWPETASFPFNAGYVARERIPIRHYPHRDPMQMEARFRLRSRTMRIDPKATGAHWKLEDWRKEIVDVDGRERSAGQGLSDNTAVVTGELHHLALGEDLIERPLHNHVPDPLHRIAARMAHGFLLRPLDARRAAFDPSFVPTREPPPGGRE